MKTNNILKVAVGASSVAQKALNSIANKGYNFIEDKILKGNYISREEFEKLQTLVIKLKKELTELKGNN
ncbi:hypothetical protein [Rickettsia prowazekii]|uniref:Uncharacterized protein RP244 n=2 Tax=Rickettsia prowazekii TaxID=782 RepID=Y244_RICPR|nr:hypothetical protein [Rickettsia prowazekii]Q9ZDT1.1 RecName: Full=Uncharacterized protein RP244 [Rickettsia prowazekii str. Madrid E]EOB10770.1 Multidrug resistance protein A [Rickettsia prowazekii str. GvF12]ADE29755.1 hypothetical protein rpr22_CDS238 [Rickettsia prowazekii str. Rp22]AFE49063.1 hypothetical protein M9W_01190 [Rickettsia prowazekii str. Chernikova]AFE49909.1 hypothetical protein M9Y_01195 [Rickettsia prowazekii str. Katsinyian]AFE50753.1 hypothetical protein MA1_01185 [R